MEVGMKVNMMKLKNYKGISKGNVCIQNTSGQEVSQKQVNVGMVVNS